MDVGTNDDVEVVVADIFLFFLLILFNFFCFFFF